MFEVNTSPSRRSFWNIYFRFFFEDLISLDSKFSKRLKTLRQAYEAQAQRYYYDKMGAHREEDFLELEHQAYSFSQDYVNRPDVINKLRQICVKDPDCDIELLFFEFEDVSSNALQSSEVPWQHHHVLLSLIETSNF